MACVLSRGRCAPPWRSAVWRARRRRRPVVDQAVQVGAAQAQPGGDGQQRRELALQFDVHQGGGQVAALGHHRALALAGGDDARTFELLVGAPHRDDADAAGRGQFADRRQRLAGRPVAGHHLGGDLVDDLLVHRPRVAGRQEEFHGTRLLCLSSIHSMHSRIRRRKLARRLFQRVAPSWRLCWSRLRQSGQGVGATLPQANDTEAVIGIPVGRIEPAPRGAAARGDRVPP